MANDPFTSRLVFFVNNNKHVLKNADPLTSLASFLRNNLTLTGTKVACNEGGCGACTVMVSEFVRQKSEYRHYSVNACLMPLLHVHGKAITTVEGVRQCDGSMHAIQEALCKSHGTQCGYCTPGFVMAMYTLLQNNTRPNKKDVDEALQGNLCRCTGYRSVLDAFYTFQTDSTRSTSNIEELENLQIQTRAKKVDQLAPPAELIFGQYDKELLIFTSDQCTWYRPVTLDQLLRLKKCQPTAKLIAGNTEIGIDVRFRNIQHARCIYIGCVEELKHCHLDEEKGVYIGAAVTISEAEEFIRQILKMTPRYKLAFLKELLHLTHRFAGKHIRNVATIVGNVINASPVSDLSPLLMAAKAVLFIASSTKGIRERVIDQSFFSTYKRVDIAHDEIVLGVRVPFSKENQFVKFMKQSQRREDDISIVNAAFNLELTKDCRIQDLLISFGGMAPVTKSVQLPLWRIILREWSPRILDTLTDVVKEQFVLSPGTPGGMEAYRMTLQLSFVYQFCQWVTNRLVGTIENEVEQLAISTQIFNNDGNQVIGRPVGHLSNQLQVTGEAMYCDDIQIYNALHLAFVLSQKAHAKLIRVEVNEALEIKGVIAYFDVNDIPKEWNNYFGHHRDQPVFADQRVTYFGQVIGIVVAVDAMTARRAANNVKVLYEELPVVITIEDAIRSQSFHGTQCELDNNFDERHFSNANNFQLQGEVRMGGQEHFYFETNACIAIPLENDEMEIISSTQNLTDTQIMVAGMFNVGQHKISAKVKRIGGGFGGKETATMIVTLPTAFAARKLNVPVRCCLERYDDMVMMGTRHPFLSRYKAAYDAQGQVHAYSVEHFSNCGSYLDLSTGVIHRTLFHSDNAYKLECFKSTGRMCKTNFQSATAFRGFGAPQGMFAIENCLVDIAHALNITPEEVRQRNLYHEGDRTPWDQKLTKCNIRRCWDECAALSQFEERKKLVDDYNAKSRWNKRGISMVPTKFGIAFGIRVLNQAGALVHVYKDGTVLISHSGVEMGQGLHTKMVQVASHVLKIPMDKITIKQTTTDTVPNTSPCAASYSSDLNGLAVKNACEILLERLRPIVEKYPDDSWESWISKAYFDQISLSTTGFYASNITSYDWKRKYGPSTYAYFTYGVACTEVNVDSLTGNHEITRTDIVMDTGESLNPAIDIGQIEGAFVQGSGLFTIEELKVSPQGAVYTRGPGTYKIPSADDIPRQFNVKLIDGSENDMGIFSSKGVGEPPLFLGSSVYFAIKEAVKSVRGDCNLHGPFRLDSPATCEKIRMACGDSLASHCANTIAQQHSSHQWTIDL